MTTRWTDFETAKPDLAKTVRERFGAYKHHVLATLRADGSPRVSGIEADFRFDDMWLGGMPGARKSRDLMRDPRFALYANPGPGTDMDGGDVRVAGRAVLITDADATARYAGEAHPPEPFDLFRIELGEVVRVHMDGDDMVIQSWRPGHAGVRTRRRGNDDSSVREV
jgi:hypothetical protein